MPNVREGHLRRFWHVRSMSGSGAISEMPIVRLCRLSPRRGLRRSEQPIHRGASDPHGPGNLGGAFFVAIQLPHLISVDRGGTALVPAIRLGLCDAFELTLAPQIGFELSEYGEHAEKSLTARIAGVDVGIQHPQRGALLGEQIDDAHEIADRPRQAVELRYRQDVAGVDEVEDSLELVASLHLRAAALLRPDDGATSSAQRFLLDGEVLIRRADPSVADGRHLTFLSR